MKVIHKVSQSEVFNHWEKVENISIAQRTDVVFPLVAYSDLKWSLARLEGADLDKLYVISSDDWKTDGLCIPDFKLVTAINNYQKSTKSDGKFADIKAKEDIFVSNPSVLDTKFIFVAIDQNGPFTLIEGNKRSVALGSLGKLTDFEVYLGISPAIKNYVWSRYAL